MKKKIVSLVLLVMYFFGGIGMILSAHAASTTMSDDETAARIEQKKLDPRTGKDVSSLSDDETTSQISQGNIDPKTGTWTDQALNASSTNGDTQKASGGSNDMTSSNFSFDVSNLSPSEKTYKSGTRTNLKNILANIGKYLLIATTTIAVLSLVIGGLMISTTGPSDRAAKGKTIITLNITAIVIALLSYSIIRLVSWLIA